MNSKSSIVIILLAELLSLILLLTACQNSLSANNPTTPSTLYPPPATNYSVSNTFYYLDQGGAYATAKIMNINQQQIGYPWKADVLIQNITEIVGLTNPIQGAQGKVVTVYTNQNLGSFKTNDLITFKVRTVFNLPNNGQKVQFIENVTKN
jgi:hypothetical protein